MSEKSEALRLADAMSLSFPGNLGIDKAAAELRRQHEEITELRHGAGVAHQTIAGLVAQRDALLAALKRMASIIDKMGDMPDGFIHPSPWQELKCEEALTQARAAIKKAEGGQ